MDSNNTQFKGIAINPTSGEIVRIKDDIVNRLITDDDSNEKNVLFFLNSDVSFFFKTGMLVKDTMGEIRLSNYAQKHLDKLRIVKQGQGHHAVLEGEHVWKVETPLFGVVGVFVLVPGGSQKCKADDWYDDWYDYYIGVSIRSLHDRPNRKKGLDIARQRCWELKGENKKDFSSNRSVYKELVNKRFVSKEDIAVKEFLLHKICISEPPFQPPYSNRVLTEWVMNSVISCLVMLYSNKYNSPDNPTPISHTLVLSNVVAKEALMECKNGYIFTGTGERYKREEFPLKGRSL